MEIDFSSNGEPSYDFEDALPSSADGTVEVDICGVVITLAQKNELGERLWASGLQLARDIEQGVVLRHLEQAGDDDIAKEAWLKGKRVVELGAVGNLYKLNAVE